MPLFGGKKKPTQTRVAFACAIISQGDMRAHITEWGTQENLNFAGVFSSLVPTTARRALATCERTQAEVVTDEHVKRSTEHGKNALQIAYLRSLRRGQFTYQQALWSDLEHDELTAYSAVPTCIGGSVAVILAAFADGTPDGLFEIRKKDIV